MTLRPRGDAFDRLEDVLQPRGRCLDCGGGETYWRHKPSERGGEHAFRPPAFAPRDVPWPDTAGPVVYYVLQGSHSFGLADESSDQDWRGVFMLPNQDFLGLYPSPTTWEDKKREMVFWELGHFCRLLLKGNPNIVSMLSVPDDCLVGQLPFVETLRGFAPKLVTQSLRSAYMGWIADELRRVQKAEHGPEGAVRGHHKRLSHVPRLIWEYEAALEDGAVPGRLRPDKVARLREIKFGAVPYQEAYDEVAQMYLDLEQKDEKLGPSLPEAPIEEVRRWLVETRQRFG